MGRIEDLKETAPCGMEIHYTVDENDMIAYNDINGRGVFCDKCEGCTWRGICKPERQAKTMSRQTYVEIYNLIDIDQLIDDKYLTIAERNTHTDERSEDT